MTDRNGEGRGDQKPPAEGKGTKPPEGAGGLLPRAKARNPQRARAESLLPRAKARNPQRVLPHRGNACGREGGSHQRGNADSTNGKIRRKGKDPLRKGRRRSAERVRRSRRIPPREIDHSGIRRCETISRRVGALRERCKTYSTNKALASQTLQMRLSAQVSHDCRFPSSILPLKHHREPPRQSCPAGATGSGPDLSAGRDQYLRPWPRSPSALEVVLSRCYIPESAIWALGPLS